MGLAIALGAAAFVVHNDPTQWLGDFGFIAFVFTIAWLAGLALGSQLSAAAQAIQRAEHLEREREAEARAAVAEERARIARELHDVVGHSVSVMTVQASAVRRLLTPEQEREREALLVVEQTGREALAEMRRLVGVLRRPEEAPALVPQPSLEHVRKLVEQTREAGLPTQLNVEGEASPLPAGIDLTAYRLVQEGLTNALKHANATQAEVLVRYEGDGVELGRPRQRHRRRKRRRERTRARRHARARVGLRRQARGRADGARRLRAARAPAGHGCVSVRVLIVDDQALVRTGFRMILEAETDIEVVGEAPDGAQAIEEALRLEPDVVLMDVRMPELDGIEATRRLLSNGASSTKVVMLTTFDMDEYVYDALRAGASGFLLKDVPPEQLIDGIRAVANGDALLAPSITRRLIEEFVRAAPTRTEQPAGLAELTSREVEVLRLIARGFSNAEIAKELFVSETTVKTHVAHVLMKLDVRDRVQAVVLAYESGIVQPGASPS